MARTKKSSLPITALSPSRAKDFMQCPKLFFYKTILGIATPPSEATLRGTLAHYAFEHVFDHPVGERGPAVALSYVVPAWRMVIDPLAARATVEAGSAEERLRLAEARFRDLHDVGSPSEVKLLDEAAAARALIAPADEAAFLTTVEGVVRGWYAMENPDKFTPVERERYVRARIGKATVHGYIDRLDAITAADGAVRTYVSDYKGLALDTPLPTVEGWTTMGRVRVGDMLLGVTGTPVTVTAKTPEQELACFQVVFADGTQVTADEVHLWPVDDHGHRVVCSTRELSELSMPVHLAAVAPLELPARATPVEPFAAGRSVVTRDIVSPFSADYQTLLAVSRGSTTQRRELLAGVLAASSTPAALEVCDAAVAALVEEILVLSGCQPERWTRDAGISRRTIPVWLVHGDQPPTQPRIVEQVRSVRPVTTQCLSVDAPDHLYLAGRAMSPTHNTGRKPSPRFADEAFFQLEVYAALLEECDGTKTHQVRLIYTKENNRDGVLTRAVTEETTARTRKKIQAVWDGIERANQSGNWPTRKQTLCDWCHFQPVCPAWHPELDGLLPEEIEHHLAGDFSAPTGAE